MSQVGRDILLAIQCVPRNCSISGRSRNFEGGGSGIKCFSPRCHLLAEHMNFKHIKVFFQIKVSIKENKTCLKDFQGHWGGGDSRPLPLPPFESATVQYIKIKMSSNGRSHVTTHYNRAVFGMLALSLCLAVALYETCQGRWQFL